MSDKKCASCSQIREAHCLDYESTCIDCRARDLERYQCSVCGACPGDLCVCDDINIYEES